MSYDKHKIIKIMKYSKSHMNFAYLIAHNLPLSCFNTGKKYYYGTIILNFFYTLHIDEASRHILHT